MAHYTKAHQRPWGRFYIVHQTPESWVKTLVLKPWSETSLQIHRHRNELWHVGEYGLSALIDGERVDLNPDMVYAVLAGIEHRIINATMYERTLVEVATGRPDEEDIVRLNDAYGRT